MATHAQILANRENAKKSTGPKTEAGKAKSSMNRLSHGFASSARFSKGEDPEEFYALLNELMAKEVGKKEGGFLPAAIRPRSQ